MPENMSEDVTEESEFNPDDLPDLLPLYYKRLFPHKPLYRWLSYGNCEYPIIIFLLKPNISKPIYIFQLKIQYSQIAKSHIQI